MGEAEENAGAVKDVPPQLCRRQVANSKKKKNSAFLFEAAAALNFDNVDDRIDDLQLRDLRAPPLLSRGSSGCTVDLRCNWFD